MKSLGLLLAAALAVVVTFASADSPPAQSHDEIIDKLIERTNKITTSISHVESLLDDRLDPKRIRKAGSLRHRVEELEDPSCDEHEHQCGGDDPQCISKLFVCDGHNDCRNGEDEKDCTLPTKAGDKFIGDVVFDHCTKRRPEHMTLAFESSSIAAFFTPIADLHVHIEIESETDEDESEVSMPADGEYSFADHRLTIHPPEEDGLGLVGEFDGYNFDRFVGHIVHELSEEVCAEFIFHRKK
nr:linker L3a [Lumbricus terrestris]